MCGFTIGKIEPRHIISLDAENETLIQQSLSRLIQNKTVMIIAHRMRTIAGADKIVVIKNGKSDEQGTPDDLINQDGEFAKIVRLQQQSADWTVTA